MASATDERLRRRSLALSITCPTCGSGPGLACTGTYRRKVAIHVGRRRAAGKEVTYEGNNGGSYVRIMQTATGMVELEIGESCVVTVHQRISVAALAVILTAAKDKGFQKVVDEYLEQGGGQPEIRVEHDTAIERAKTLGSKR